MTLALTATGTDPANANATKNQLQALGRLLSRHFRTDGQSQGNARSAPIRTMTPPPRCRAQRDQPAIRLPSGTSHGCDDLLIPITRQRSSGARWPDDEGCSNHQRTKHDGTAPQRLNRAMPHDERENHRRGQWK